MDYGYFMVADYPRMGSRNDDSSECVRVELERRMGSFGLRIWSIWIKPAQSSLYAALTGAA